MSENKLLQSLVRVMRGFTFLIVLTIIIGALIYLREGPFDGIAQWLSQSSEPRWALIVFSLGISTGLLFLLRLGFQVPLLNRLIASERLGEYLVGLNIWILVPMLFVEILVFWQYLPSCVPPMGVQFKVEGANKVYEPLSVLEVKVGEGVTLVARDAGENKTLSCYWEYSGDAFGGTKSQSSGCQISLRFQFPGEGIVTVATRQNFCPQTSLFSLRVLVKP